MNRHMRQHSQRLNIKTTHLASLTAVFCSKKKPGLPATNHSHPPATDTDLDNHLTEPSDQVNGPRVIPEVPIPQLDDGATDDSDESDSDEMSEGMLVDSDSDEFESDEDVDHKMGEGRGPLEFELRASSAGNVHHGDGILTKN